MSDRLEPPQEVWDVLRDRARHRALDEKGGYATTWVARRSHTPFGVPAGKLFDGFNADITALDSMLFELRKLRIARQVYGDGDEQACPGAARLVIVRDLQDGEDPRRNAEGWEFVVHRPDFLRRGDLLDQGGFFHHLNVLLLVLGVVASYFAPKLVECGLGGGMLTDPAVPSRAVVGTLGSRVELDSILLVLFAFLPTIGSFEHFASRRNDLLIRGQLF